MQDMQFVQTSMSVLKTSESTPSDTLAVVLGLPQLLKVDASDATTSLPPRKAITHFHIGCGKHFVGRPRAKRRRGSCSSSSTKNASSGEQRRPTKRFKRKNGDCVQDGKDGKDGKDDKGTDAVVWPCDAEDTAKDKNDSQGQADSLVVAWHERKSLREFFSRPKIALPLLPPPGAHVLDLTRSKRYLSLHQQDADGKRNLVAGRQRSAQFFRDRRNHLTGSKLVRACGLFGFDALLDTYYETYEPDNAEYQQRLQSLSKMRKEDYPEHSNNWYRAAAYERSEESKEYGTRNEANALSTVLDTVAEDLDVQLYETSVCRVELPEELMSTIKQVHAQLYPDRPWQDGVDDVVWRDMLRDTPDALGIENRTGHWFALENKAPYKLRAPLPYKELVWYQVPQQQNHLLTRVHSQIADHACISFKAHMSAPQPLAHGYLVAWSGTTTKIWKYKRDLTFWKLALPLLMWLHKHGLAKTAPTPAQMPDKKKVSALRNYCKKMARAAEYIGEYRSAFSKFTLQEMEDMESGKRDA